jgi:formyltetrahydrofolate deformylase
MKNSAILLISCPDRKGEVATIADFVYRHGGNILHADEHADEESGLFLMRVEFDPKDFDIDLSQRGLADFGRHFAPIAEDFQMKWRLAQSLQRPRMIILVSKYDHCLVDLLYRHKSGELACDIPLIISNHADNQAIADFYKIPYAIVPVTKDNKNHAEAKIHALIDEQKPNFVVLARYMQILSNDFVNRYPQRIINIHHSFLPAFVGARPYHQAFERGVKLIGATATTSRKCWTTGRSLSRMSFGCRIATRLKTSSAKAATLRRSCYRGPCAGMSRIACWCMETRLSCSESVLFPKTTQCSCAARVSVRAKGHVLPRRTFAA